MDILEKLLNENPDVESISLGYGQITELEDILPLLEQFPNLKELSLYGNRLKVLDEDLSFLENIEILDIRNNLFKDLDAVLPGLATLPRLRSLEMDLRGEEDKIAIKNALPNLEILNSQPINAVNQSRKSRLSVKPVPNNKVQEYASFDPRETANHGDDNGLGIKKDDLDAVGLLFQCIKEIHTEQHPDQDDTLLDEFDGHVQQVMQDLSKLLTENDKQSVKQIQVSKAKYALYEICFEKINELVGGIDPRISTILSGLHDAHAIVFKDLAVNATNSAKYQTSESLAKMMAKAASGETAELLEAAEQLERENQRLRDEKDIMFNNFTQERKELEEQIAALQEENSKYLDTIVKHSKDSADELTGNKSNEPHETFFPSTDMPNNHIIRINNMHMNPANAYIGQTTVRALTIKQMKDMVAEIYASKIKYDTRCLEAKLPRETMEQHMYTYLNQKYGLKGLIVEWATALINGIKKYSSEDNDVAVFGKILRNECDEEFRFVQQQVKITIAELLKMYLRSKHPLKNNAEVKAMLDTRMSGTINEDECIDIINYMYNQEDADFLLVKLRKSYIYPKKNLEGKKISREEYSKFLVEKNTPLIDYSKFQKVILDFQLKSHEKFLSNFIHIYRMEDKDMNGILDEMEFRKMMSDLEKLNIHVNTQKLLYSIDPYNHHQITFSQCVSLFSSQMIQDGDTQMSILQRISLEGLEDEDLI